MSAHTVKRKGQLEILGISIVVILMIGALVVAVKLNKPQEKSMRAINSQQANSYLSSALEVTAGNCKKYSVKDLIIDCWDKKQITCDDGTQTSCQKYNEVLQATVDATLAAWKKNYELKVGDRTIKASGCTTPHKNEDFA